MAMKRRYKRVIDDRDKRIEGLEEVNRRLRSGDELDQQMTSEAFGASNSPKMIDKVWGILFAHLFSFDRIGKFSAFFVRGNAKQFRRNFLPDGQPHPRAAPGKTDEVQPVVGRDVKRKKSRHRDRLRVAVRASAELNSCAARLRKEKRYGQTRLKLRMNEPVCRTRV